VADAIARVHPFGVDVVSGVESSPGHKDARLVRAFVSAAKAAAPKGWPADDEAPFDWAEG
jgi:phosphoribosylanthranilate isomerase